MIILSDQFGSASKGVYTTAAICLSLVVFEIDEISAIGIKFNENSKEDVIGAICIINLIFCIATIIFIVRDYIFTFIGDDIDPENMANALKVDFSTHQSRADVRRKWSLAAYDAMSWAGFAVIGLAPLVLGIITCTICWPYMLDFVQKIEVSGT